MTRRHLLGGLGTVPMIRNSARAARRPNVVFVLTDDHGAWSMGAYGCGDFETPNLDRLANEGARFTRSYVCTPVCSPSRMTLMTGKLPSGHGVQGVILPEEWWGPRRKRFLDGHLSYTETLARNGYALGMCGKWHMGDDGTPQAGFSYWCTDAEKGGGYKDPTLFKNGNNIKINGFSEDAFTDAGLEFIDANRDRPFFLYLPLHAPHASYAYQPEKYRKPYYEKKFTCFPDLPKHPQRRRSFEKHHGNRDSMIGYAALITAVDQNVARIVKRLEELGLREDTLIVLCGDNGWNAGHHGVWGKGNATIPFNMYEESVRVPLIWNQPSRIRGGLVPGQMVSSYDFLPTILEYLGLDAPPDRRRVGRSYAGVLRGENPDWPKELFFEYCYTRAIRTETWKYVQRADNWWDELYDLGNDPGETVNVIGWPAHQKRLAELRSRLKGFFAAAGAPPIDQWHSTSRQILPIDAGYYDGWLKPTGG